MKCLLLPLLAALVLPTAVDAIKTSLTFLQSGVIDRENKSEIKKIRRALEQLEGEPSDIVDI